MKNFIIIFALAFIIIQIFHCSLFIDDSEAQWIQTKGPYGGNIQSLAVSGIYLFAGTQLGGVFRSNNNGTNWTAVNNGLTDHNVRSFAFWGTNLFAGTSYGVFLSTDYGTSWTAINNGLTNTYVTSLAVLGTNLFAGTSRGVWRRPLSEMSIQSLSNEVPEQYSLEQNFPNPFNPVTNLEFGISKLGFVTLKIYDLLGKEVAKLVNEKLSPGRYRVEFDVSGLPSGVYFYRLETEGFLETKSMVLLK